LDGKLFVRYSVSDFSKVALHSSIVAVRNKVMEAIQKLPKSDDTRFCFTCLYGFTDDGMNLSADVIARWINKSSRYVHRRADISMNIVKGFVMEKNSLAKEGLTQLMDIYTSRHTRRMGTNVEALQKVKAVIGTLLPGTAAPTVLIDKDKKPVPSSKVQFMLVHRLIAREELVKILSDTGLSSYLFPEIVLMYFYDGLEFQAIHKQMKETQNNGYDFPTWRDLPLYLEKWLKGLGQHQKVIEGHQRTIQIAKIYMPEAYSLRSYFENFSLIYIKKLLDKEIINKAAYVIRVFAAEENQENYLGLRTFILWRHWIAHKASRSKKSYGWEELLTQVDEILMKHSSKKIYPKGSKLLTRPGEFVSCDCVRAFLENGFVTKREWGKTKARIIALGQLLNCLHHFISDSND